jgi:hypothetical protein
MRYSQGTREDRIKVLRRLIATEQELLAHPKYWQPAARIIARAREELAALEAYRAVPTSIATGATTRTH